MAWPTDDIVTTNVDAGADSAASARANLYTALLRIKDIIAGRNTANGVCPLDSGSKVPVANIPTLSYLPSTGGTVSGATTFGSTLAVTGAVTFSSTLQVASNITVTSGAITASANYVKGAKNSQTSYATAGLISESTTGNAGIGLHCSGASAAYIEHTRGGNGVAVKDSVGAVANLTCKDATATTLYAGSGTSTYLVQGTNPTLQLAANVYFQSQAGDTYYTFDTADYLRYNKSSDTLTFYRNNSGKVTMSDSGIYGTADNAVACGVPTNRWTVVYAVNGTIQTSDKRRKDHVGEIAAPGAIIDALRPVRFKWKQTGLPDVGFYAQDVAPLVPEATVPGTETVDWGMLPDRLIPFLVAEIQHLRARVAVLEARG